MFQAAVDHSAGLQQTTLVVGLHNARSLDFSFPQGPNDFTDNRVSIRS